MRFVDVPESLKHAFMDPQSEAEERADRAAYTTRMTWKQYFPYVLSTDGKTARVGWEEDENSGSHQWTVGYDIEVKKIDGEWLPVECRQVTESSTLFTIESSYDDAVAVIPDVPRR